MAEPVCVSIVGRDLRCQHCGHQQFYKEETSLDRLILGGLFRLEGMPGHQAVFYACARCGFTHFFTPVPSVSGHSREESEPEETCLSCGKPMQSEATSCASCGWTWSPDAANT